jgi:site-specific DNA recombinase
VARRSLKEPSPESRTIRCAVYTRKSTEDGLEQEFNSLDAQRESAEAYIKSQASEGWVLIPDMYDDGGFTGGNMDRPGLARLMADIEAGKVDCVVVYKVDRLSRSLLDFARMMSLFDQHKIAFVSVTQQFNTANSMGRLMLNVLLSFAQFEREIISERTRDKIAATRRKGKWTGGMPLLGYDVEQPGSKLVVNETEATQVRQIYELYLEHRTLLNVVKMLTDRGWCNKRWTTRKGTHRGGLPFTKTSLHKLLTNPTYLGKVKYKRELHDGEHEAIIDQEVFQRVQTLLIQNSVGGGGSVRNSFGAVLKGLLRCRCCDAAMVPSITKKGDRRYRYYVCSKAQKFGWHTCKSKSVPAAEMERFVIDQIRSLGTDPEFVENVLEQIGDVATAELVGLRDQERIAEREIRQCETEMQHLSTKSPDQTQRLAAAQERMRIATEQLSAIQQEIHDCDIEVPERAVVQLALQEFDPVWNALSPREQERVLKLLVQRVDYNGETGQVDITFAPDGFEIFLEQFSEARAVA